MRQKQNIRVCGSAGELIEIIKRVIHAEQSGNFNPIFCTYKGAKKLVKSEHGDLSDPFRRTADYLTSLYIEIPMSEQSDHRREVVRTG